MDRWTFAHLARLGGERPVTLVAGNRELGTTRFIASTFGSYVASLENGSALAAGDPETTHLKEFDLLREIPGLRQDLSTGALYPRGHIVSSSAWIGPAGARTGLHYDLLDNLAVLVRGSKRFYLARPGTVEALGQLSRKHDRWARLASVGISDLAARDLPEDSLFTADLHPGDAIYVPKGWWHEVVNLKASIFLSGFFGPPSRVIPLWLATGAKQLAHDLYPLGRRNCTCHSQTDDLKGTVTAASPPDLAT